MTNKFALITFLLTLPVIGYCQQSTLNDPLLDSMTGKWVLSGDITGKATTHDVEVEWALNHQFLRIHETSREKTAQSLPQYEAEVYLGLDAKKGEYVVHWIDVFGGSFSSMGYGAKSGNSIPLVFKSPDGDFHTTFTFDEKSGTWQWTMDSEKDGKLQPFARLKMVRSDGKKVSS